MREVVKDYQLRKAASQEAMHTGSRETKTGFKLQPAFVLRMMGYPEDWLDLEAGEMPPSKRRGTRSSRRSQK
jgi:hypothetical protein